METKLGAGGMADVYRGRDLRLKRSVAIKIVDPRMLDMRRLPERFVREAWALAAVDSPSLVPIYDVGTEDGRLYLIQKLLEGESLDHRLGRGGATLSEIVNIACDVLEGLEALHDAGMVHRDIKPSNVFVTSGGRAVVLDLGIVFDEDGPPLTDLGVVLGTPEYMSPEHALGKELSLRSDLYAVGLMLLFALTGRSGGVESDSSVRQRVKGDAWLGPQLEYLPAGLRPVLRRALARDSGARFETAAQMRAALRAVPLIEDRDALVPPSEELPTRVRPVRNNGRHGRVQMPRLSTPTVPATPTTLRDDD